MCSFCVVEDVALVFGGVFVRVVCMMYNMLVVIFGRLKGVSMSEAIADIVIAHLNSNFFCCCDFIQIFVVVFIYKY